MKKNLSISMVITVVIIAMTLTFSVTMIASMKLFDKTVSDVKQKELMYNKIAEIDKTVRDNFYTTIDDAILFDMIGTGYVAGLGDKNSKYYTANQFSEINAINDGKLMGIGAEVIKDTSGYFKIVKIFQSSPAHAAGLEKGFMITAIDETAVKTLTLEAANSLLNGQEGTNVKITYLADTTEKTVDIQHKIFDLPTVEYSLEKSNGYIKISTFTKTTAAEMDYAINLLIEQGALALVFDIRGNAGGRIEYAAACADLIVPAGTIASGLYQNESEKVLYTSGTAFVNMPMVVITNTATAAGAELFAVTLRDFNKTQIIGETTSGKGTIQNMFAFKDGSAVDLTVAKILPGKSDVYDGIGLVPDYVITLTPEEQLGFYDFTIDTDPQISRAFEVTATLVKATTSSPSAPDTSVDIESAVLSDVTDESSSAATSEENSGSDNAE